jgi:hypothetical protein
VLLHDTYSGTVDLVCQFLPVLIANGYQMVTVSHLLGDRAPSSTYGGRENGPPANAFVDIPRTRSRHCAPPHRPGRRAQPADHRYSQPESGRPAGVTRRDCCSVGGSPASRIPTCRKLAVTTQRPSGESEIAR